jgi:hypothetical protein
VTLTSNKLKMHKTPAHAAFFIFHFFKKMKIDKLVLENNDHFQDKTGWYYKMVQ